MRGNKGDVTRCRMITLLPRIEKRAASPFASPSVPIGAALTPKGSKRTAQGREAHPGSTNVPDESTNPERVIEAGWATFLQHLRG